MECTEFKDCNGEDIYVGQCLSVWDQEGGSGVGVVVKDEEYGFLIIDPAKDYQHIQDRRYRLWCFTQLKSFAPNGVEILKQESKSITLGAWAA